MKIFKLTLAALAIFATFTVAKTASAVTTAELTAAGFSSQEAAVIMALFGGSDSSSDSCDSSYTHMGTLKVGSTGSQVMDMQEVLGINADGSFGPMTKTAVMAFQTENGLVADGVVGAMTGAALESSNCDEGDDSSDDSSNDDSNDDSELSGGAGSVQDYTLASGYSNEEVGEDEEDVIVAGLEVEADEGSDLEIRAVKVVFDEVTAASDFEDYATEVSIWMGDEEFARVDADEFNEDNAWTRTLSLDGGAIIGADDMETLYVAVSGTSNLDTNDISDSWSVDFRSIRFMDGQGGLTNEDPTVATRTFTFESFATASDVELKIASNDADINDARIIQVDATDDTDGVEALSFTLEAEGDSDVEIKDFGVNVDVTGASHTDDVIKSLHLIIDGEEYGTFDCFDDADCADAGADEDYIFEDVDYVLGAGETVDASIEVDFFSIADDLDEGDTIAFTLGETETDQATLVNVEDEAGENLVDADVTGSVTSTESELRSVGVMVEFVDVSTSISAGNSATDDVGTFVIEYDVTAFGGDVYVSDTDTATTATSFSTVPSDQVLYTIAVGGTATDSGVAGTVDFEETNGITDNGVTNGVLVPENKTGHFTLTVTRTNTSTLLGAGSWKLELSGVSWATSDTATQNVYDFDLQDFETDSTALN